ncbi:hypothetical protein MMC31_001095, partial [Peltigera leucophlebia]|nr:hypothetical protein [Peltigera leucophlebia]
GINSTDGGKFAIGVRDDAMLAADVTAAAAVMTSAPVAAAISANVASDLAEAEWGDNAKG